MPLVCSSLKSQLLAFLETPDSTLTTATWALKLSTIIANYAMTSLLNTAGDSGTYMCWPYIGVTTSATIIVQPSIMANVLTPKLEAMNGMTSGGNEFLAEAIADATEAMMKSLQVIGFTVGTAISQPYSVPIPVIIPTQPCMIASFSGQKAPFKAMLKASYKSMGNGMTSGGNKVFAEKLATAFDTYLKTAQITCKYMTPPMIMAQGMGMLS